MSNYRDRITGLEYLHTDDLESHPGNWRDHPKQQVLAMHGVLAEVGIAGALLGYRSERAHGRTVVIDGHLRKDLAQQTWPVLMLDVDDAEADYLLATHDPLAAMAQSDAAALDALLDSITTQDAAVRRMLAELAAAAGVPNLPNPDAQNEPQLRGEVLIEIYCSHTDLAEFQGTLNVWSSRPTVSLDIS